MNKNGNNEFGQRITAKWLSSVPKGLRFLLIFGGLLLLVYIANRSIWF